MALEISKLVDLVPGKDRFPARYIPIIREGLERETFGPTVMQDAMGTMILPPKPVVGTKFRWGKLDGTLSAGSYATVSLWQGTDGSWGGWDQDSGENWEECYAPPILTSGSLDSGNWVLVGQINGRKVVLLTEC